MVIEYELLSVRYWVLTDAYRPMVSSVSTSLSLQRNTTIQVLRALAIIAVVMIHTTPSGYWQVVCRPFLNFSVAMFLFLSGYLTKTDNQDWSAFYRKRIIRVLIPYVIWTVIYTLDSRRFDLFPLYLFAAKAQCTMYYIFVYIQFVLLTPLIGKLAVSRYKNLGWFVSPLSIIAFKYYWLFSGQEINVYLDIFWSDSCLGWFTFYYLGILLGNKIIEKNYSMRTLSILCACSIVLQMAETYLFLNLGSENCGSQLKLSSLLTSSLCLLIAYTILKRKGSGLNNGFLVMIGDYSFGIYLCHMLIKHALYYFVPFFRDIPFPVSSAIVVVLSFCFCYACDKMFGRTVIRWLGIR